MDDLTTKKRGGGGNAYIMAGQPTPRNKGLIRPYQGKPMVNEPSTRPYFWGVRWGGWLINYDYVETRVHFLQVDDSSDWSTH